jgi:hypothetical protein
VATKKLGRSLLAGATTVDELRKLTRRFRFAKHYFSDELTSYVNDSVVVDGDLTIAGDFDTCARGICRLVVTGNLKVSGVYQDHDDPQTAVFVLGDLEATNAITAGALGVAGDVRIAETLVGFYNDHAAELHGQVTARTFVPENHFFSIGSLACEHLIGRNAAHRIKLSRKGAKLVPVADAALQALLVPEVIEVLYADDPEMIEVTVDDSALRKRVREGKPILRARATQPTVTRSPARKPSAGKPIAKKPVTREPLTTKPITKKPVTRKPVTKKPITTKPVTRKR